MISECVRCRFGGIARDRSGMRASAASGSIPSQHHAKVFINENCFLLGVLSPTDGAAQCRTGTDRSADAERAEFAFHRSGTATADDRNRNG